VESSTKHFKISISDLKISAKDVEKLAHIDSDMPSYSQYILDQIAYFNQISNVQGGYSIRAGRATEESLWVEDVEFKVGAKVSRYYKGMTKAAVFVCTAGEEVTERVKELNTKGDLVEAYLVDVIGSVIVEKAMDVIQERMKSEMAVMRLKISNRYSPGYCDWNVSEQKQLFSFLPENFCNITLSDSCLMHPTKTVSGIIAVGEKVHFHKHVCHACSSVNCLYRDTTRD